SVKTSDVAYEIEEWYNSSVNIKRSIITMMRQSQHPVILTCGKLYILSLDNFANVSIII
ncbi:hypothetical protein L9F63_018384, partial [Diploptera punctata]